MSCLVKPGLARLISYGLLACSSTSSLVLSNHGVHKSQTVTYYPSASAPVSYSVVPMMGVSAASAHVYHAGYAAQPGYALQGYGAAAQNPVAGYSVAPTLGYAAQPLAPAYGAAAGVSARYYAKDQAPTRIGGQPAPHVFLKDFDPDAAASPALAGAAASIIGPFILSELRHALETKSLQPDPKALATEALRLFQDQVEKYFFSNQKMQPIEPNPQDQQVLDKIVKSLLQAVGQGGKTPEPVGTRSTVLAAEPATITITITVTGANVKVNSESEAATTTPNANAASSTTPTPKDSVAKQVTVDPEPPAKPETADPAAPPRRKHRRH